MASRRSAFDVAFHYAGQGSAVLITIAAIPFYVQLLGTEAYGVIGFYLLLQSVIGLLDLGLSPTVTREASLLSENVSGASEFRSVLRTFEYISLGLSLFILVMMLCLTPIIAAHWSSESESSRVLAGQLSLIIVTMGLSLSLRFYESLHRGVLLGLRCHGAINIIKAGSALSRWGLGLLLLWVSSLNLIVFFLWQALTSLVVILVNARLAYCQLGKASMAVRPSLNHVRSRKKFLGGMVGVGVIGMCALQLDKLMAGSFLSLAEFSYYSIAWSAAAALLLLAGPIHSVVFPRFANLHKVSQETRLEDMYLRANEFMAFLLTPVATSMAVHSDAVLRLWGQPVDVVMASHVYLSLFALAVLMNIYVNISHAFQVAIGMTHVLVTALSAVVVFVALGAGLGLILFDDARLAAAAYLASQCLYALAIPVALDRLRGTSLAGRILIRGTLLPLAIGIGAALLTGRVLTMIVGASAFADAGSLLGGTLLGWIVLATSLRAPRQWITHQIPKVHT